MNPRTLLSALTLVVLLWAASLPAAPGERFASGLLFQITGSADEACWVFGTIHSEDPRVIDLPTAVRDAFESADAVVLEVVPDAQAILQSMVRMVYTDGRSLESVVGPELYREAVEAAGDIGMPEAAIKDFKPWALVTLLSAPPGSTGEFLDLRLYRQAAEAGKRVEGLETIDEQLSVFEGLSEADQVTLLRETLEVRGELPAVFERLLLAYVDRDLQRLQGLSEQYLQGGDPALAERFRSAALDVRNARMAERMAPILEQGGCFIAVGALHLPGGDGVLERLERRGFTVRLAY
jgi:uncharacterized protein YbaP (TraB family)